MDKIRRTPNNHNHSSPSANTAPDQAIQQFLHTKPFLAEPNLSFPLSKQLTATLKPVDNYPALWTSRKKEVLDGMNLQNYIDELTSTNFQGDYVVFGLMGAGIAKNTIQENAVVVFIVVNGPLAYMAQMDWSLSTQKNPKPYQQYIEQCFKNYIDLKTELEGKDIPHGTRLLVVESNREKSESNHENPRCQCIWANDGEALNPLSSWSEPTSNQSLRDIAHELIEFLKATA